jgi:cytochrome c553
MALTPEAQEALTTILNLRTLTKETGTKTTRAQNDVLRALSSKDIAAVANTLAQQ